MKKLLLLLLLYSSVSFGQGKDTMPVIFIYSDTSCEFNPFEVDVTDVFSHKCLLSKPGYVIFWRGLREYRNINMLPIDDRYKIWNYKIRYEYKKHL
jgi:hypothetical protein